MWSHSRATASFHKRLVYRPHSWGESQRDNLQNFIDAYKYVRAFYEFNQSLLTCDDFITGQFFVRPGIDLMAFKFHLEVMLLL